MAEPKEPEKKDDQPKEYDQEEEEEESENSINVGDKWRTEHLKELREESIIEIQDIILNLALQHPGRRMIIGSETSQFKQPVVLIYDSEDKKKERPLYKLEKEPYHFFCDDPEEENILINTWIELLIEESKTRFRPTLNEMWKKAVKTAKSMKREAQKISEEVLSEKSTPSILGKKNKKKK